MFEPTRDTSQLERKAREAGKGGRRSGRMRKEARIYRMPMIFFKQPRETCKTLYMLMRLRLSCPQLHVGIWILTSGSLDAIVGGSTVITSSQYSSCTPRHPPLIPCLSSLSTLSPDHRTKRPPLPRFIPPTTDHQPPHTTHHLPPHETALSCFAVLPFILNVLTAGILARNLTSSVPYALGVN